MTSSIINYGDARQIFRNICLRRWRTGCYAKTIPDPKSPGLPKRSWRRSESASFIVLRPAPTSTNPTPDGRKQALDCKSWKRRWKDAQNSWTKTCTRHVGEVVEETERVHRSWMWSCKKYLMHIIIFALSVAWPLWTKIDSSSNCPRSQVEFLAAHGVHMITVWCTFWCAAWMSPFLSLGHCY